MNPIHHFSRSFDSGFEHSSRLTYVHRHLNADTCFAPARLLVGFFYGRYRQEPGI